MTGAKGFGNTAVVFAALVFIADEQRDRRAGGLAFEHTGENFHRVRFAPLRDMARGAWFAQIQLRLYICLAQYHSRRTAIDDTANRRAV